MTLWKWSQTAASNASSDSTINWAEGQTPGSVNNSARALMAAVAKFRDDNSGNIETAGSSTAYTITSNQTFTSLSDGISVVARIHTESGASPTLAIDGLTAKSIHVYNGTEPPSGSLKQDTVQRFTYDSTDDVWYVAHYISPGSNIDDIAGLAVTDGNIIVGDGSNFVAESGATARTSLGLGTGNTPQFTGIEIGHASDTTLTRSAAGKLAVEGNNLIRANDAATDSGAGVVELTDQSEMEAASSTSVAVTPGRQHFHPGHPKAGGQFVGTGTPAFASGDYGMGSITDNGTGNYTLALDTAFSNTNYWVTGWARATNYGTIGAHSSNAKTTSSLQVRTMSHSVNNNFADADEAGITFWGDYA